MGSRGGGRKEKKKQNSTVNYTPSVVVEWKPDNYLCNNPSLKREIEDAVRDQAPKGAYSALIRCVVNLEMRCSN